MLTQGVRTAGLEETAWIVPVIIVIAIVVVIALFLVSLYNGLVTKRNQIDEALGQIEVS